MNAAADTTFMITKLVLCLGSPGHVSDFRAYTRLAHVDFPAPRHEVVLCPISDDMAVPAVVTEMRIGGGRPILVIHSDEPLDGGAVSTLEADSEWEPLQPASALKGDVLGVFLDEELTDLLSVEAWPEWKAKHTHFMISVGLVGNIPVIEVDGLDKPLSTPPAPRKDEDGPDDFFTVLTEMETDSRLHAHTAWRQTADVAEEKPPGEENIVNMSAWRINRDN